MAFFILVSMLCSTELLLKVQLMEFLAKTIGKSSVRPFSVVSCFWLATSEFFVVLSGVRSSCRLISSLFIVFAELFPVGLIELLKN